MATSVKLLLVEDNPGDERLIREYVAAHATDRCEIRSCATLECALADISQHPYDAVLLDMSLPDSHGLDTVRAVLRKAPTLPVVVLTGNEDAQLAEEALHLGAQDYLRKQDLDPEMLCRTVTYAIERSAYRSELRLKNEVFDAGLTANCIADPAGRLTHINTGFLALWGYETDEEVLGRPFGEFFDDAEEAAAMLDSLREHGSWQGQFLALRKQKTPFIAECLSTSICDESGEVVSFQFTNLDVTQRMDQQRRLEESEARYRLLFDTAPVGIGYYTVDGDIIAFNHVAAERMHGKPEDFVGVSISDLYDEADTYLTRLRAAAHSETSLEYEDVVRLPVGERCYLSSYSALRDSDGIVVGIQIVSVDFTAQREAQAELRASEERYRGIVEGSPLGILTVGWKGTITSCNPAFLAMTGCALDDIVGRHFTRLPGARAQDLPKYIRLFRSIAVGKAPEPFETSWIARDGSLHHGEIRANIMNAGHRDWAVQVTVLDITQGQQIQQELELTKYSMDSTRAIILWLRPDGTIVFVNESACTMLGYTREQLLGKHAWDLQPDYPKSKRAERWEDVKSSPPTISEAVFVCSNGDRLPLELNSRYLSFRGTEYEFVIGIDISERQASERALRESEENYRTIFDSANDAIMVHDAETGAILDSNRMAEELFGYSSEAIRSLTVGQLSQGMSPYSDEEALSNIHAAASGDAQVFEWRSKRKDGKPFWTEVNLRAVTLLGRRVVLALVRDISERKELEARLWQSQRLESIGTLASGVAHEINNPLMGMINYAELISSRVSDDTLRGFADEIKLEGSRVAKIVRNLLSFARQDRERHSPARIRDIVDASLSIIGSLLRKDFVQITLDLPENLPSVRCRSQQIQQVLINLLTNARDSLNIRYPAADENKIVSIVAHVMEDPDGAWLRTSVEDAGTGIPGEVMDRIFDPFFTTKTRDKGTGLGLSISYGIVQDHNGRLIVESEPGRFTRFHMDLPLSPDEGRE